MIAWHAAQLMAQSFAQTGVAHAADPGFPFEFSAVHFGSGPYRRSQPLDKWLETNEKALPRGRFSRFGHRF